MKLKLPVGQSLVCLSMLAATAIPLEAATFLSALNALTVGESTSTTVGLLSQLEPSSSPQHLTFVGEFTDSGWGNQITGTLNGKLLSVTLTGVLTGTEGSDITVDFSGTGTWGSEPITISHGQSLFTFSGGDYSTSDFQQLTKVGSGTDWGWARGLEWVGGATLGAIGGAIACSPGVITAVGGGVIGGIAGGETVATFSDRVWTWTNGGGEPPPPGVAGLTRPSPTSGTILNPSGSYELTAYDFNTGWIQSQSGNVLSGATVVGGSYSGNICVVPEPGSLAGPACLIASALIIRSRRKRV